MCNSSELCRRRDDDEDHKGGQITFDKMMTLMQDAGNFSGPVFTKLTTKDAYASFVGMCASGIVGYHRYKTALRKYLAKGRDGLCHNWITPDDEAMCWLMIENGLGKWNAEFELRSSEFDRRANDNSDFTNYGGFQSTKLTKVQRRDLPLLKYTEKTTESGKKKLCAWSHSAVTRFKKLKREIQMFRYEHDYVRVNNSGEEELRPVLEKVNGKNVYKLTRKYREYSEHATSVMSRLLQEDSPASTKKRRIGQDISEHEQKRKREIDAIYNDGSLSMFSNVACSMPFLDV